MFASVEHRVSALLLFAAIGATLPFVMVVAVAASPLGAIAGIGRRYLDSTPRELAAYAAGTVVAVCLWVAALFTGAATAPEWTVTAIVTAVLAAGAGLAAALAAVKVVGAVYTKSREKIERAKREFHVGNLYINRKCTGATVAAHPFGGFNMSGTDSKSGGPDYLYLFTQGKAIGEKI